MERTSFSRQDRRRLTYSHMNSQVIFNALAPHYSIFSQLQGGMGDFCEAYQSKSPYFPLFQRGILRRELI
jgi:hypothetical protein